MKLFTTSLVVGLCMAVAVQAQDLDLTQAKAAIEAMALKEQQAFKNGDCDTVLSLMEEEITFLANGRRVPSKQVVGKFCNSLKRPFKPAEVDELVIYPLTDHSGYTIRTLEYTVNEKKTKEFVTKIWRKKEGAWKITHLHSTAKQAPTPK